MRNINKKVKIIQPNRHFSPWIYTATKEDSFDYEINGVRIEKGYCVDYIEPDKEIDIKWNKCKYCIDWDVLKIELDWDMFTSTFFWDEVEFIKRNEELIFQFFLSKMDWKIDKIFESLSRTMEAKLIELSKFNTPHTRTIVMTKMIEAYSKFWEQVAKKFDDRTIWEKIKSLFIN